jgi:PKD repeat protein
MSNLPSRTRGVCVGIIVLIIASVLGGCSLFRNQVPVAHFVFSPSEGECPLTVQFDAESSYDPDGYLTSWQWDFGDGQDGSGTEVSHVFDTPGVYSVSVSVRDNLRAKSSYSSDIVALEPNEAPVARFSATPTQGEAPLTVQFDASASHDSDGNITIWDWSFGDGYTGVGPIVSHRYGSLGTFTVQLLVTDDRGKSATGTTTIRVTVRQTIERHYRWEYGGRTWDWDVSIPGALYEEYRRRYRGAWVNRDYDEYVLDPLDDAYLSDLVDEIAQKTGNDYYSTVECLFHFVQAAVDYAYDPMWSEYPRYPVETLVEQAGDCEDTAILYASLVRTLGAGAMLAAVDTDHNGVADHMITLVPVDAAYAAGVTCRTGQSASFWQYNGTLYALAETTGDPHSLGYYLFLGCDPWSLHSSDFLKTWDVSRVDASPRLLQLTIDP